jgi:hypothetical protein
LKRLTVASLLLLALSAALAAQSLSTRVEGDQLRIAAPRLHFLVGEARDRLHDGATVKYEFQLTATAGRGGPVLARTLQEFAVSYDLWEEKFAVRKLGASPRSVSHLSETAAETWCLENISIPVAALGNNKEFWLRLDFLAAAGNTANPAGQPDNSGFTLTGLIDIFSRRTRSEQVRGSEEIGPLRLDGLKRK